MLRTDFHFDLPAELIAQRPAARRSASRMLFLDGAAGSHRDLQFSDLPSLLNPGDLLVFNDTRVIPARVMAAKESGGRVEILLERALTANTALVHLRASKGLKVGAAVRLPGGHPCLPGVPERSPQAILAAHGLVAAEPQIVDAAHEVSVTPWRRAA